MNESFQVASILNCEYYLGLEEAWFYDMDSLWRQTLVGCRVLQILQDMYGFNISSYVYEDIVLNYTDGVVVPNPTKTVDIYARPLALGSELIDDYYPILPIYTWRYGFTLRSPPGRMFESYFTKPFSRPVWCSLYLMTLFVTLLFCLMTWWENRLLTRRGECSFDYELLVAVGAFCQHVLPVRAVSQSRRIAYFTFFLFAFVIYTYYSSNLLSDMVNVRQEPMDVHELVDSDYEFAVLENVKPFFKMNAPPSHNKSVIREKLSHMKTVNLTEGLQAVRNSNTALLSDYITLYPAIRSTFDHKEICRLMEVDVFSEVKKYFFTSKNFAYKEEFKIGTLQAKEAGVLSRLIAVDLSDVRAPRCAPQTPHAPARARLAHVLVPLTTLGCTYILGAAVLVAERLYHSRFRVFPFVN